jgi:hypothetical protein
MRVWDQIEPSRLCRQHLLGEHREIHALWNIIKRIHAGEENVGYANHPETLRWVMHVQGLMMRHEAVRTNMYERGYNHHSPLGLFRVRGLCYEGTPAPYDDQVAALAAKECCG